jgi:hypothetical protein
VGLRAGLDTETRGNILCLCRGSNPGRPVCIQTLYSICATKGSTWSLKNSESRYTSFLVSIANIFLVSSKKALAKLCGKVAHKFVHLLPKMWIFQGLSHCMDALLSVFICSCGLHLTSHPTASSFDLCLVVLYRSEKNGGSSFQVQSEILKSIQWSKRIPYVRVRSLIRQKTAEV